MTDKIRVGIVGATVTQGGSGWGANAHVDLKYTSGPISAQLQFCPAGPTNIPKAWCDDYPEKFAKVCSSFPCPGLGEFGSVTICCCYDKK